MPFYFTHELDLVKNEVALGLLKSVSFGHSNAEEDQHAHIDIKRPPFSREDSFSGCILVLNQNHRMTEWIAYHYFALPLRTLFIAYDPKTKDRATELVKRWKNAIHIIEWDDEDYLFANWTHGLTASDKDSLATVTHITRQLHFYQKCHERSVGMGIRRTIFLDPDEYLRINPAVIPPTVVNTSEPGHITQLFQQLEAPNNTLLTEQKGVTYHANCSIYPRVQFTTLGPSHWYSVPKDVDFTEPDLLVDPSHFNTLRYRYRNLHRMKHPKGLVDAVNGLPHQLLHLHYPLDRNCSKAAHSLEQSPLVVNHYIGSFEDFFHTFRSDARNDAVHFADIITKWERRARGRGPDNAFDFYWKNSLVRDESITSWVPAFLAWQSDPVARTLLRDTGTKALGVETVNHSSL